jgi:sporulation protein YlmC with PRC-barrel domain
VNNVTHHLDLPSIICMGVAGIVLFKRRKKSVGDIVKPMASIVPTGWQFFPKLTNGDPPGTIFRITSQNQKFYVGEAENVPIRSFKEIQGKITQKIYGNTSILAKILALNLAFDAQANRDEELVFEMGESIREITRDEDIDRLVETKLAKIKQRKGDRYFVIRETSSTKEITFELKKDQVKRLGGEAKINESIKGEAVFSKKDAATFELRRKFPELMRVMFSAEEVYPKDPDEIYRELEEEARQNRFYLIPIGDIDQIESRSSRKTIDYVELGGKIQLRHTYAEAQARSLGFSKAILDYPHKNLAFFPPDPHSSDREHIQNLLTIQGMTVRDSRGKAGRIESIELNPSQGTVSNFIVRTVGKQAGENPIRFSDIDFEKLQYKKAFTK